MKQLFLVRHAKSDGADPQLPDKDRKVTAQGQQQVAYLAERLKRDKVKPGLMLCSDATRAQQTAQQLAVDLGVSKEAIQIKPVLYEESVSLLIEAIKAVPEDVQCLMIVAHNPTLSWFATYLNHDEPVSLSTCGLFAIQFEIKSWLEITEVEGEVVEIP